MSETPTTVRELCERMDVGLAGFEQALDRLGEEQLTGPRDHVGWTIRDHLTHLAVWADGITALLRGEDRWKAMGATPTLAANAGEPQYDFDVINAQIAEQHRHRSGAEARAMLVASHRRLAAEVAKLTDEQLMWPYKRFGTPAAGDGMRPIAQYIAGDTYEHYTEHLPWILAIGEGKASSES